VHFIIALNHFLWARYPRFRVANKIVRWAACDATFSVEQQHHLPLLWNSAIGVTPHSNDLKCSKLGTWGAKLNAGFSDYEHHSHIGKAHNEVKSGVSKKILQQNMRSNRDTTNQKFKLIVFGLSGG